MNHTIRADGEKILPYIEQRDADASAALRDSKLSWAADPGHLFDKIGRKPMITICYCVAGLLLAASLYPFVHGKLGSRGFVIWFSVIFHCIITKGVEVYTGTAVESLICRRSDVGTFERAVLIDEIRHV